MELSTLPPRGRLTWLVGPPGAGKSTFLRGPHGFQRTLELNAMLAPLVEPTGITAGVLEAHGRLVQLLRAIEHRPENAGLADLLVVGGLIAEDVLFPLPDDEQVWLLRPPREDWEVRFKRRAERPGQVYRDERYSAEWYERFGGWLGRDRVHEVASPQRDYLLGLVPRTPTSQEIATWLEAPNDREKIQTIRQWHGDAAVARALEVAALVTPVERANSFYRSISDGKKQRARAGNWPRIKFISWIYGFNWGG